ncbi:MAG: amylosucrase, partial [Lachnospiraceae bacterium]|nr:amylosucrase [Lachnospiraceae bacterium]
TGDARFCGTTASMCGIEAAERGLRQGCPKEETELAQAISLDVMLHTYMFFLSGIPILYSGDEVAQKNDYSYREDPWKADDSRYIHRGRMDWEALERLKDADSTESRIFYPLARLEEIRRTSKVFVTNADVWTVETGDDSVLGIGRCFEGEKVIGLFNFCENDKTAWISETDGMYEDLLSSVRMQMVNVKLPAYGFRYLRRCAC